MPNTSKKIVGVFGATSFVGERLLAILSRDGWRIEKFSRADGGETSISPGEIPFWICVAPLWVLPTYFDLLLARGVKRVVTLSTTSRFTKGESGDPDEIATARKFIETEKALQEWAEKNGVEWVILRPTLIYGFGRDKNITQIAGVIRRFGFFPLFGAASGLRQPIHAEDVAQACVAVLGAPLDGLGRAYNISGGETLSYREMVARVFKTSHRPVRTVRVPLWIFRGAVSLAKRLPKFRHWSAEMATRMNRDLVFDHSEARRHFGFAPRAFELTEQDLGFGDE